jgi:hypothetical protein
METQRVVSGLSRRRKFGTNEGTVSFFMASPAAQFRQNTKIPRRKAGNIVHTVNCCAPTAENGLIKLLEVLIFY